MEWDDRLEGGVKGKFQYSVPAEGKPVGWLPPGRERRVRYPELPVGEEGGVEESEMDKIRTFMKIGGEKGDEAMTGAQTPQSSDTVAGVEGIGSEMSIEIPISETSSTTLRGDSFEVAEENNGDSIDLTMEDPVNGEDDGMNAIVLSDNEDLEISEGVEREVGGGFDESKPVEISDDESCEILEDFKGFEDFEGIERGVVKGLIKGD